MHIWEVGCVPVHMSQHSATEVSYVHYFSLFQELGETKTLGSMASNEPTESDPEDR
jgi:hypothetical protein